LCSDSISSCDNTVQRKTAAQRKRDSRQKNTALREREQSLDTARRKGERQDTDVRQQEQTANTARRKQRRQNAEYRQQEQINDTARKRLQHDYHSNSMTIAAWQILYVNFMQQLKQVLCLSVRHVISLCTNTVFRKPALYVHWHYL